MLPFGKAVWRQGLISFETEAYGTSRQDTKSSIAGGVIKQCSHVGDSLAVPRHDAELVTVQPSKSLPRYSPKRTENNHTHVQGIIIHDGPQIETRLFLSAGEGINNVRHHLIDYYLIIKKE